MYIYIYIHFYHYEVSNILGLCYNDGNLYESIDNLNVKCASAATYDYAYNDADATKVKLPKRNFSKQKVSLRPFLWSESFIN